MPQFVQIENIVCWVLLNLNTADEIYKHIINFPSYGEILKNVHWSVLYLTLAEHKHDSQPNGYKNKTPITEVKSVLVIMVEVAADCFQSTCFM
jgi:hypothetical protein